MTETTIIPFRFRGPPNSGNGAYVAGAMAERFVPPQRRDGDEAIEVTLGAPIPLDTPMTLERPDSDHLSVVLGEALIAEAARTKLALDVPMPPSSAAALAARGESSRCTPSVTSW